VWDVDYREDHLMVDREEGVRTCLVSTGKWGGAKAEKAAQKPCETFGCLGQTDARVLKNE